MRVITPLRPPAETYTAVEPAIHPALTSSRTALMIGEDGDSRQRWRGHSLAGRLQLPLDLNASLCVWAFQEDAEPSSATSCASSAVARSCSRTVPETLSPCAS